jgi:FdhE protein
MQWPQVLDAVVRETAAGRWAARVPARGTGLPLLHGTVVAVPEREARVWASRLLPRGRRPADPRAAIARGLSLCGDALDRALARPLLHACEAAWREEAGAAGERAGSCPVCGAWPAFAEVLGVERRRRLRCAGCGAGWAAPALSCPYCGEEDHRRLASLVPEAPGAWRVDVCTACRGYVKTLQALEGAAPTEVAGLDLSSVHWDLRATAEGWALPSAPARPVEVRVA